MPNNIVVLSGIIPERPNFTEDGEGHPMVEFYVSVRKEWTGRAGQECDKEQVFRVQASGHPANSLRKYYHPRCSVTVNGELDQRVFPNGTAEVYIHAQELGYLSLSSIVEAQRAKST